MSGRGSGTRRYEVSFVVDGAAPGVDRLREALAELGDHQLRERPEGGWHCVVITSRVGETVEEALELVAPSHLSVVDVESAEGAAGVPGTTVGFRPEPEAAAAPVGVVAVVAGSGLARLFGQRGAQQVVDGGEAMAPSLGALLEAVEEAPARRVVVLPNSTAAIPLAEQLDALTTKRIEVVPTRDLSQGLAAMAGYSFRGDDLETTAEDMAAAASSVVTGAVTQAARDASVELGSISRGDWLGIADGTLVVADPDLEVALRGLVAAILPPLAETVVLYAGEGAELTVTKALEAWLTELHPEIAVRHLHGGQPGSAYLVSVE